MISKDIRADLTKVSCLVNLVDGSYLYYGILEHFYLKKDGSLDRIIITEAKRRKIQCNEINNEIGSNLKFYQIKGDKIILKYDDIKNINLEYYAITEDDSSNNIDENQDQDKNTNNK